MHKESCQPQSHAPPPLLAGRNTTPLLPLCAGRARGASTWWTTAPSPSPGAQSTSILRVSAEGARPGGPRTRCIAGHATAHRRTRARHSRRWEAGHDLHVLLFVCPSLRGCPHPRPPSLPPPPVLLQTRRATAPTSPASSPPTQTILWAWLGWRGRWGPPPQPQPQQPPQPPGARQTAQDGADGAPHKRCSRPAECPLLPYALCRLPSTSATSSPLEDTSTQAPSWTATRCAKRCVGARDCRAGGVRGCTAGGSRGRGRATRAPAGAGGAVPPPVGSTTAPARRQAATHAHTTGGGE